jgi:tripartite-type tricarboxylate transporter receptor subunit TctC
MLRSFAALALAAPALVLAQYPAKPIKIISTIPLGGSGDVAVRLASSKASESIGQQVLVETNGAAGGTVGARLVAKSAPDGYTLFHSSNGALAASVFTVKDLGYHPLKEFTPVTLIAQAPSFIAVGAHVPVSSVKELVEYAKKNPGKLSFGSNGIGSYFHITGETFRHSAGIDMLHIPYTGGNVSIPMGDLLTGRIDVFWPSMTLAGPHLGTGKLKLLAVLGDKRLSKTPDVPTIAEAFPQYKPLPSWFALVAPAGTPQPIVSRIQGEMAKALGDATVTARLNDLGMNPGGGSPEQLRGIIASTIELSGAATKLLGIQPQ